jgi:hypothetical protein
MIVSTKEAVSRFVLIILLVFKFKRLKPFALDFNFFLLIFPKFALEKLIGICGVAGVLIIPICCVHLILFSTWP